ncbi:hypothetical protein EI427_15415 [Flammeovirga pectinis]|uniref:Uncharacterized protein n=1 Tax=Flammeovirga pectinis TaxID=2494373 RepID=A0A3Q9FN30_9BACT|nr:hypothetical protein [Flammeovirga pectinis]AZQ63559.1 hypothetical protein EI427_15415 [Flammeovirga pectinis]
MHTKRFLSKSLKINHFLSRWYVLGFEMLLVGISFLISLLIRFNFNWGMASNELYESQMGFVVLVYFFCYLTLNIYSSSLRHTNLSDIVKIFNANTLALFVLGVYLLIIDIYFMEI